MSDRYIVSVLLRVFLVMLKVLQRDSTLVPSDISLYLLLKEVKVYFWTCMVTCVSCSYQINLFEFCCLSEAAFSSVLRLYSSGVTSVWPAYLEGQENILLHVQVFVWKSPLLIPWIQVLQVLTTLVFWV